MVGDPLVSVVTPVFNGERHLRECIESVLAQTYSNWNYTIINNCSTDSTLAIAEEYAARDSRIHIHTNDAFVRVIQNYNIAFRQASDESEFCKIVAADDWLFPECLEKMVKLGQAHPNAAIIGAYQLCETRVKHQGLRYHQMVVSGRDVCRMALLGGPNILGSPTTVMYRTRLVKSRHAFLNESNLHADTEACMEFLEHSDFGFVHQILTFGRVSPESLGGFSRRYNTGVQSLLYILVKYGPRYLTRDENDRRIREVLQDLHTYLGKQIFKRRDREFWRYHRAKLAELGRPMSRGRLLASAVKVAFDLILRPKDAVEKALHKARSL
jgi:glycosyltransferase involved in cell wall biosynthesis